MTRNTFRQRIKKVSLTLTIGYICMALAGVAFVISTPITIEDASTRWQSYAWATMLIVGGLFSASDLFTGRRGGELFGSPFIAGACFLWGAALLWRQWHTEGLAGAGTGLAWLLFGVTMFIIARFTMLVMEFNVKRAQ